MVSIKALIQDILQDPINKDLTPLQIGEMIDSLFLFSEVQLVESIEGEHEAGFCLDCDASPCECIILSGDHSNTF